MAAKSVSHPLATKQGRQKHVSMGILSHKRKFTHGLCQRTVCIVERFRKLLQSLERFGAGIVVGFFGRQHEHVTPHLNGVTLSQNGVGPLRILVGGQHTHFKVTLLLDQIIRLAG